MRFSTMPLLAIGLCAVGCAEDVKIVVEAEHYRLLVPHMAKVEDETASGGWCVAAPTVGHPCAMDVDPGYAAYRLRVPADGRYRLWARCLWPDGARNSLWLRVGSWPLVALGDDGTYMRWHWVKGPIGDLKAGEHVIVFRCREEAGKLDQFVLVNDAAYLPVRQMAETPEYIMPLPSKAK